MFNVRFLIWFFKLLSITLPLVIAAKILFLKCYPCIVILLGLPSSRSSYILQSPPPPPHHKKLKPQIIIRIIKASVLPERYQEKECSCFDFLAHSLFTFDVFCGSLCTSIFGNSSLAANKTWSRMHSRLYFRFLWLWFKFVVMNSVVIFLCLLFYFSMTRQFFFCFFVLFFVKESLYSAIIKFNKQSRKTTEQLTLMGMCIRTCYSKGSII